MILKDKVVVITWASAWIGKAIALRIAKEWAILALVARSSDSLEAVKKEALELWAANVLTCVCDLSKVSDINATTTKILEELGWVDVLINNAWIWQKLSQLEEVDPEYIDQLIAVNFTGTIHMTHRLLPSMKSRDNETALINVSSKSWIWAAAWQSVYAATKWWVRGFTDVLKLDLQGTNVRVAGIYQAGTRTEMFEKTGEDFPVEKFTDPADLADTIGHMLTLPPKIWLNDVRVEF